VRRYQGAIVRTPLPVGQLTVTVSTRLSWHQRTPLSLFSPELERHLLAIGAGERQRIGIDREFTVEARGDAADSWQQLTWPAGSHSPTVREVEAVEPPFDTAE
jgi:hypothetical protein